MGLSATIVEVILNPGVVEGREDQVSDTWQTENKEKLEKTNFTYLVLHLLLSVTFPYASELRKDTEYVSEKTQRQY